MGTGTRHRPSYPQCHQPSQLPRFRCGIGEVVRVDNGHLQIADYPTLQGSVSIPDRAIQELDVDASDPHHY